MVTESNYYNETINFFTNCNKSYQTAFIDSSTTAHSDTVSYFFALIKNNAKVKPALQKLKKSSMIN